MTAEEVEEVLRKHTGNEMAIKLAVAGYQLRLRPKHVLDLDEGRRMVAFTTGSISVQDVRDAENAYERVRHARGLGLVAKKAADKTPKGADGKPKKQSNGERRMTVARFLFEDVFPRKTLGTDEEIIKEVRKQSFCGETFKTNDKSAKQQLQWYKGKYTRGEFPGAVKGKVYDLNQPFTSDKKKDSSDGTPGKKRPPRKAELKAAEGKAKKPKLKGKKTTATA